MSSSDHLVQYLIGLICLLISNIFYFFYFNSINSVIDKPFLVTYLQSIMYIIVSILFCLFEHSRFKLTKNRQKNRLLYSPLVNQFDSDADLHQIFEMTKPFKKNGEKTFLTDPVWELISEEDDDDDDEQFKLKYQDKLNNYDEYLVKVNEKYNELTKTDEKHTSELERKGKKVKFNKKKEVRHLKGIYAQSAILSRLSYEAFMQFNYQLLNKYSNLAFSNSISIVPFYAIVHFLSIYFTNLAMNYYFEPINYFDLNTGFSLIFIIIIQYFFFSPSFTEKITFTKSVICLISLISLYLIRSSSNASFIQLSTSSDSNFIINRTVLNDSNITDLFSIKIQSIAYTLLSSFLSTLFLISLRNKYERDDFDLKIFSIFLSLFTMIVFAILLLFVLNRRLIEPVLIIKHELITILHQALMGPTLGHFFLVIGCFYTNTMVAILSLNFLLPINYSINLYSTNHLNHKLFIIATLILFACFITLIYITFYEFSKSKRKDFLIDLFKSKYFRIMPKIDSQNKAFLDEEYDD